VTPALRHADVVSEDGTRIRYHVAGSGRSGHTWVIPPGLGAPLRSWSAMIERFQHTLAIVTWDGRGFHGSAAPRSEAACGVVDSVRDMRAICAREGLTRFVLGGWSMAVQIALEYTHQFPGEVEAPRARSRSSGRR
jgi:pimeloyl-ACP methyl ester carboxylesterase